MGLVLEYTRTGGRRTSSDTWEMRINKVPVMPDNVTEVEPGKQWQRRQGDALEIWRVVEAA